MEKDFYVTFQGWLAGLVLALIVRNDSLRLSPYLHGGRYAYRIGRYSTVTEYNG